MKYSQVDLNRIRHVHGWKFLLGLGGLIQREGFVLLDFG